jgi:hypothetical protein
VTKIDRLSNKIQLFEFVLGQFEKLFISEFFISAMVLAQSGNGIACST